MEHYPGVARCQGVLPDNRAQTQGANMSAKMTFLTTILLIGGMSAMAPERKHEIVSLGLRSILSGTMAGCMSGAVVGMLV